MTAPFGHDSALDTFAFEQITVGTSAVSFTAATRANAKRAIVRVETADVRWRADGTAPTASVGMPLLADDEFVVYGNDVHTIQFIRQADTSATVSVSYAR